MSAARTVLLVEDDFDVRESISDVLRDEGFAVVTASDGREALDRLESGVQPSVILLDLMMAGMNGFQFREAQLEDARFAAIPVVVLTADRMSDGKIGELGIAAHVRKPVRIEQLVDALEAAIAQGQ